MLGSSDRPVTINIPKLRNLAKDSDASIKNQSHINKMPHIKRIVKKNRILSKSSIQKYSFPAHEPLQVMSLKEELVLSYKLYAKKQERIRHLQKMEIDLIKKYKIMYTDLRKRLYVEDPIDDVYAVTDFDEGYFRYLSGRPLAKYIPRYKSLQCLYSDGLRMRQEIGYRRDSILNIESSYRNELKEYNRSIKRYKEQVNQFDKFISEDYSKSMDLLNKWDELKGKVNKILYEQENLATQDFTIVSRLIGLDYAYSLQQKYGRFLYYLSPPSWRLKHREFAHSVEIEAKGFDLGISSEEDTFNQIFEKMQFQCASGLVKPPLYFEEPHQIMELFESIEKQQLHHFSYVNHLAPHAETLKADITKLKERMVQDTFIVIHWIKDIETFLEFFEEKESFLYNKFMKIIYEGMFYESVGAIDALKFKLHLDFCYEKLFKDTPTNMNLYNVAKALEEFYLEYNAKLDSLHNDKIKVAAKHHIEVGKMRIGRANVAAKELRLFTRLQRELLLAFEPIRKPNRQTAFTTRRRTVHKIKPNLINVENVRSHRSTQYSLTDAEQEFLTLFTDWTDTEDPSKYLQCLKIDKRRSTNEQNK